LLLALISVTHLFRYRAHQPVLIAAIFNKTGKKLPGQGYYKQTQEQEGKGVIF